MYYSYIQGLTIVQWGPQFIKYIIKIFKITEEELLASYKNLTVDSVTYQKNRKKTFRGVKFSRGVWISKKEKPSSGIEKYQFSKKLACGRSFLSYLNSQFSTKLTSIFRE